MHQLKTVELLEVLKDAEGMEVFERIKDDIDEPCLQYYLNQLLKEKGKNISWLASETLLDRSFVYQMFNGIRIPSRNHLLRMAFALALDMEETQRLLKLAHRGELYPRVRFDAVIIYCLYKKMTLYQANEFLEKMEEAPLL